MANKRIPELDPVVTAAQSDKFIVRQSGDVEDKHVDMDVMQLALLLTESQITDLQSYLLVEVNDLSAAVVWDDIPDANVPESAVTQHEAALTITESQISDLQAYLLTEANDLSAAVVWDDIPDANVPESAVTQHEAALSITESQISDLQAYLLVEANDLSAAVVWDDIPDANVPESAVTQHEAALTITESQISDLQAYLLAELNDLTAAVVWADVPDGNVTESSVTQHEAALTITESQISDLQAYLLAELNDLTAAVVWANVPDGNITESSVTQHEAALSITESQISDLQHTIGVSGLGIWKYRTETTAPPATGQIRFNNANISLATEFYLSETNEGGVDVSTFLELLLQDGSVLYIQDQTDAANFVLIEISSSVDNGSYRTFGIQSVTEEGTEPGQNDDVVLITTGLASAAGVVEVNDLTAAVTWADIPDTNVPESAVTQHEAALTITESQISDLQAYLLTEANDLSAAVVWDDIPDANVPESAVTQHEAAIDHDALANFLASEHFTQAAISITESQISDLGAYLENVFDDSSPSLGGELDMNTENITAGNAAGPQIVDEAASATNPTFIPNKANSGTGIGAFSASALSLIANGVEGIRLTESEGSVVSSFIGVFAGVANNSPQLRNTAASSTVPTLIPNKAFATSGIGLNATGEVSIIGIGVELARSVSVESGGFLVNNTVTGAGLERVLTVSDLAGAEVNDLTAAVVWDDIPDGNVPESAVTQHEAALTILESQITDGSILARVGGAESISNNWKWLDNVGLNFGTGNDWSFLFNGLDLQLIASAGAASSSFQIFQAGGLKWELDHGNDRMWLRDGYVFRISDSGDTDFVEFSQDSTDFNSAFTNTLDWNITGLTGLILTGDAGIVVESGNVLQFQNAGNTDALIMSHDGDDANFVGINTADVNFTGLSGRIKQGAETLAFLSEIGTGDVTKVGTPVNNQVGVWTGDGTIEGDTALTFDAGVLTSTRMRTGNGNGSLPAHSFSIETGTGMYRQSAGVLGFSMLGTNRWFMRTTHFHANLANGPAMVAEAPSATNAVFAQDFQDLTSGLGGISGFPALIGSGVTLAETIAAASGGLRVNNTLTGAGIERVLTVGDLPAAALVLDVVQARRTTDLTLTSSYVDVTLDTTDIESDSAVVEHDAVTDRIVVKETGLYEISYDVDVETNESSGSVLITADGRVRVNDTGSDIPGSIAQQGAARDTSFDAEHLNCHISNSFYVNLTANDFVTLQLRFTEISGGDTGDFEAVRTTLKVKRIQ